MSCYHRKPSEHDCIPILVKVWAGKDRHDFRYIRRSIPSLLNSDLPESAGIVLVNDRSLDHRIEPFLNDCAERDSRVQVWTNPERMGPNKGQEYNFQLLAERFPRAQVYVTCDDDVIYHQGWLQRTLQVMAEAREMGLRGILSALNVPIRPSFRRVELPTCDVLVKERQAALNWVIPRDVYEQVGPFVHAGIAYDTEYCDRMAQLDLPVICLKPSYVQNIGYVGAYQSDESYTANDYVGRTDAYLKARYLCFRTKRKCLDLARRVKHTFS